MKIRSIKAVDVRYPFSRRFGEGLVPHDLLSPASHFQRIQRAGQSAVIVVVTDEDGVSGYGECFGLPSSAPACALISEVVGPAMVGIEVDEPEAATAEVYRFFLALGNSRGPAMEAISGVDIALWDLAARRAESPLATYLGGAVRPVDVYASPVPFCASPAESAALATRFLQMGYRGVKLKIGRGAKADLDHIRAVREVLPQRVELMLDANCAFDRSEALVLVDALQDLHVAWLEEPVDPEDFQAIRDICAAARFPIAYGENDFTLSAFERLIDLGVRYLQPNVSRALGVSGMRHISRLANASSVNVAVHGVGASIGVATALHLCAALPNFTIFERNHLLNPLRDEVGVDFSVRPDGTLLPPQGSGHGGVPKKETSSDVLEPAAKKALSPALTFERVN